MKELEAVNLRNELHLLQTRFSHDILYNRATRHLKCRCFDSIYQSGVPTCRTCQGSGYVSSVQRVSVIAEEGSSSGVHRMPYGNYAYEFRVYYFDFKQTPAVHDVIIETAWTPNGFPVNPKAVYEIQNVYPTRGDHGRVEVYKVTATLRPEWWQRYHQRINTLPGTAKQMIADGMRYLWGTIKN